MSSIHRHTCVYMYICLLCILYIDIIDITCLSYIDLHLCTQILDFLFLLLDRVFLSIPRCPTTGSVGFKLRVISSLSLWSAANPGRCWHARVSYCFFHLLYLCGDVCNLPSDDLWEISPHLFHLQNVDTETKNIGGMQGGKPRQGTHTYHPGFCCCCFLISTEC